MSFEWIPVTPDTVPDKTPDATKRCYLVTILNKDGVTRETIAAEWGPVAPVPLEQYKSNPLFKNYIFDDWAFGEIIPYGIDYVVKAIAWAYMPDPYEGATKSEDPWYYTLGARIAMRDMDGEWHNGVVCSGYRFKDGIVTMERDDGLGKLWCGEKGEKIWFRKLSESKAVDRERTPELINAREAYKNSIQANEERDKVIFEKVKESILEAIKKGYMYCEVEMLPASIVERLEELGYTVDLVKVKYHGADPYCLISWPIDDDDY